jgi:hypothetical protein
MVQTINDILDRLYRSKEIDECIRKIIPDRHFDDFKQELFLTMHRNEKKVIEADKKGRIKFLTVRLILCLRRETRNVYHKMYLKPESFVQEYKGEGNYCEPCEPLQIRKYNEDMELAMLERVEKLEEVTGSPYYRLLVEALKKYNGNYREVSRQTGIPVKSVSNAMKKIRELIK